ncbi:MAG: hypothetical protein HFG28_15105 [Eubacterium sp.]|nr:hypothetical protein [Eubacterium sp.]
MIILFNCSGQTCNQWMAFASCLSNAHRYRKRLICPLIKSSFMRIFQINYQFLDDIKIHIYYNNFFGLISKTITKVSSVIKLKSKDPDWKLKNKKVYFFWNWNACIDYNALREGQEYITKVITFHPDVTSKIDKWWKSNIKEGQVTIAVHLRRGDYKNFSGGQYYYNDEQYVYWMKNLMSEQQCLLFLLFSNESLQEENFKDIPIIIMSGNAGEDLYAMSRCDYVMGPPSSFSRCAAYMGRTKRLVLLNKNERYSFSDFYKSNSIEFYKSHVEV